MVLVSVSKLISKSISRSGEILKISLGKTSRNSLNTGTNSMRGFSETRFLTLTISYKKPL